MGVLDKNDANRSFKGILRMYLHLAMLVHPEKMGWALKKTTATEVMKVVSTSSQIVDNFSCAIVE